MEPAAAPAEASHTEWPIAPGVAELNAAALTGESSDVLSSASAGQPARNEAAKVLRRRISLPVITIVLVCVIGVGAYSMRSSSNRVTNSTPERTAVQAPAGPAPSTADSTGKRTSDWTVPATPSSNAQSQARETSGRPRQEAPGVALADKQDAAGKHDIAVTQPAVVRNADRPDEPSATARSLIAAAISGDSARLQRDIAQLQAHPPARGDRRRARQLNDRGLQLFQAANYMAAAELFRQAYRADPGDAEIRENLGYALMHAEELADAERALSSALEIAPQRATAWGSLAHIYAKRGNHREAVALLVTAYRFAPDRKKALEVYARQAQNEDDPKVRAMLAESVTRLSRTP
ncbi:MAG TPA: tetratricopeptide repeat protein [Burkholderiales bacterium]